MGEQFIQWYDFFYLAQSHVAAICELWLENENIRNRYLYKRRVLPFVFVSVKKAEVKSNASAKNVAKMVLKD